MSRSFRKYPLIKARESGKFAKRLTNRKIRRDKAFSANYGLYKRMYNSIEVKDYCFVQTLAETKQIWESETQAVLNGCENRWHRVTYDRTLNDAINEWKVDYYYK